MLHFGKFSQHHKDSSLLGLVDGPFSVREMLGLLLHFLEGLVITIDFTTVRLDLKKVVLASALDGLVSSI